MYEHVFEFIKEFYIIYTDLPLDVFLRPLASSSEVSPDGVVWRVSA